MTQRTTGTNPGRRVDGVLAIAVLAAATFTLAALVPTGLPTLIAFGVAVLITVVGLVLAVRRMSRTHPSRGGATPT